MVVGFLVSQLLANTNDEQRLAERADLISQYKYKYKQKYNYVKEKGSGGRVLSIPTSGKY